MNLLERLQKARVTLAGGWVGPGSESLPPWVNCLDTQGRPCSVLDEGVAKFSVISAVALFCAGADEITECIEELEATATPLHYQREKLGLRANDPKALDRSRLLAIATIGRQNFEQWLSDPARQLAEVLRVFDKVINRLKGEN